ncbi:ankyrin-1-like [Trichogramma pretiosum]|uniref:ankyrin-1-like n=1 Tax=Trichogramma pretiosum TaxID=7493 RepID=UPI000C71B50E|nr:ankyrin-1-like [Trichogramma pretiosum]
MMEFLINFYENAGIVSGNEVQMNSLTSIRRNFAVEDVNHSSIWGAGNSTLHMIAMHGSMEVAKLQLLSGANPNLANAEGSTPLHLVCERTNVGEWLQMFLELTHDKYRPLQINTQNMLGNTALHLLLCYGHTEAAELLLRLGADVNVANVEGQTSLHLICKIGYGEDFIALFFSFCDETNQTVEVNARDRDGNTPLHLALRFGLSSVKKVTKLLLDRGANPSAANNDGSTPLHYICENYRHNDLLEMFLTKTQGKEPLVEIDARDNRGETPLHLALRCNNMAEARKLLTLGADSTVVDSELATPLHLVCKSDYDRCDMAKLLFDMNRQISQINARDKEGNLPLHCALEKDNIELFEWLLRKGADPGLANFMGVTALHHICNKKREKFILARKLFDLCRQLSHDQYGPLQVNVQDVNGNTPMHLASRLNNKHMVKVLLRYGAKPNIAGRTGTTDLHYLVSHEHCDYELVKLYFEINDVKEDPVQVNVQDINGNTPLYLAMSKDHRYVVELLVRRGADPNYVNNDGLSVLHWLCKRASKNKLIDDHLEKLFFHPTDFKRIDPNASNKRGMTLLHAHCGKYSELTQILFKIMDDKKMTVDINVRDVACNTPLHYALRHECKKPIIELLLNRGADPNAANMYRETPLHWICKRSLLQRDDKEDLMDQFFRLNDERKQIVQLDIVDARGMTPLQWAVTNLRPDMVETLLTRGANLANFTFPN